MKVFGILLTGICLVIYPSLFGQNGPAGGATAQTTTGSAAPAQSSIPPQKTQNRAQLRKQGHRQQQQQLQQQQQSPHQPRRQPLQQQSAATAARQHRTGRGVGSQDLAISFVQATQRQHHQRHDHNWWRSRFTTIVFVNNCGYYYWDAGYWFPALGYYPQYENFEYNGPIYTYGNLLPDQVIYNVQRALKELGYYAGQLSGSLSTATRGAISAFQEDNGLEITGAIDAPTVEALGLY